MAQINISDLNEKTSLEDSDVFLVEGSLATYKITKKKLEEELKNVSTRASIDDTTTPQDNTWSYDKISIQFENITNYFFFIYQQNKNIGIYTY